MKKTIVRAFKEDGCMNEIRSPPRRTQYLQGQVDDLSCCMAAVMQGEELEDIEEIAGAEMEGDFVDGNFVESE